MIEEYLKSIADTDSYSKYLKSYTLAALYQLSGRLSERLDVLNLLLNSEVSTSAVISAHGSTAGLIARINRRIELIEDAI